MRFNELATITIRGQDLLIALGEENFKLFTDYFGRGHTCPYIEADGVHTPAMYPWDIEFALQKLAKL